MRWCQLHLPQAAKMRSLHPPAVILVTTIFKLDQGQQEKKKQGAASQHGSQGCRVVEGC